MSGEEFFEVPPKIRSTLIVSGAFNPTDLSNAADIEATTTWRVGDPWPTDVRLRKSDGWKLERAGNSWDGFVHIPSLLDVVEGHDRRLASWCTDRGLDLTISILLIIRDDGITFSAPALAMDKDLLARLVRAGVAIDVDLYADRDPAQAPSKMAGHAQGSGQP